MMQNFIQVFICMVEDLDGVCWGGLWSEWGGGEAIEQVIVDYSAVCA